MTARAPIVDGIHHVTAFAGSAAANVRFHTQARGFELIKRTVNFDAPTLWHLYYGLGGGAPGTLLTHFPEPRAPRALHGGEEITAIALAVRGGALDALRARLAKAGVATDERARFGARTLAFEDPDGIRITAEESSSSLQTACAAEIARVELTVPSAAETCAFLAQGMGFREIARDGNTTRLALGDGGSGREIDVIDAPGLAAQQLAAGTIHHVAWRVRDDAAQAAAANVLRGAGIAVTPVRDRQYFRSIYFRIPGGVLFEIATDGPGFAIDEPADALGRELKLPPQYEQFRAQIAAQLPSLA